MKDEMTTTSYSINDIFSTIIEKKERFFEKHKCNSMYVKIPTHVYNALSMYYALFNTRDKIESIADLIPCPTFTIESLEEIEVF